MSNAIDILTISDLPSIPIQGFDLLALRIIFRVYRDSHDVTPFPGQFIEEIPPYFLPVCI